MDAILCDLFETVVLFDYGRLPRLRWGGRDIPSTTPLLLPLLQAHRPAVDLDTLQKALFASWARARNTSDLKEISSPIRFGWALTSLEITGPSASSLAEELALAHASAVCDAAYLPQAHLAALEALRERYRLALVSNFDHGGACRQLLEREGLHHLFEVIIISDELGYRKPHASVFDAALTGLGLPPGQALFVGDSFSADVVGAARCGMTSAWINPKGKEVPEGDVQPDYMIASLVDLPGALR